MTRKLETKGWTYIAGTIKHVTDRAILFNDGKREEWIPRSQIEDPDTFNKGDTVTLLLPEWVAKDRGFV